SRGVAAAPTQTAPDRNPLGDGDFGSPLDARMAPQLEGGPQREVSLVLRDVGVVATHLQAAPPRPDDDVVVEVDRLEERAELVVAVLAHAQHLQAEVHLGVGRNAQQARASPAYTARSPGNTATRSPPLATATRRGPAGPGISRRRPSGRRKATSAGVRARSAGPFNDTRRRAR